MKKVAVATFFVEEERCLRTAQIRLVAVFPDGEFVTLYDMEKPVILCSYHALPVIVRIKL